MMLLQRDDFINFVATLPKPPVEPQHFTGGNSINDFLFALGMKVEPLGTIKQSLHGFKPFISEVRLVSVAGICKITVNASVSLGV